ncbi:hypothetical protein EW026_g1799 [Hermanssonia centrifuga]|uniref:Uncharacterized protein n=1 Tax=Hermanssonia centrifuga TaxID=98765 RepID=A0A4S4KQA2_9APHY|nr:hypothetical protein EW026_g1799 [Hermanssonia centrifuga]
MPSKVAKERKKRAMRENAQHFLRPESNQIAGPNVWQSQSLVNAATIRPEMLVMDKIKDWTRDEINKAMDEMEENELLNGSEDQYVPYMRATLWKEDGNKLYKAENYPEAIQKYKQSMRGYFGPDAILPSPEYLNDTYLAIDEEDWRRFLDLGACAGNISQCYSTML